MAEEPETEPVAAPAPAAPPAPRPEPAEAVEIADEAYVSPRCDPVVPAPWEQQIADNTRLRMTRRPWTKECANPFTFSL